MNNGVGYVLAFSLGAAAGAVVTWKYLRSKLDAELEEVREMYKSRTPVATKGEKEEEAEEEPDPKPKGKKPDIYEYAAELTKGKYRNYSDVSYEEEIKEEHPTYDTIYTIPPEEYGENKEYETRSLTYYADGVLADDDDEIIEDVDDVVGEGTLNRFGEYEDDSVHVRNENMKCDYEILMSLKNYSDIVGGDSL